MMPPRWSSVLGLVLTASCGGAEVTARALPAPADDRLPVAIGHLAFRCDDFKHVVTLGDDGRIALDGRPVASIDEGRLRVDGAPGACGFERSGKLSSSTGHDCVPSMPVTLRSDGVIRVNDREMVMDGTSILERKGSNTEDTSPTTCRIEGFQRGLEPASAVLLTIVGSVVAVDALRGAFDRHGGPRSGSSEASPP